MLATIIELQQLETEIVGDKFEMLVTVLTPLFKCHHYFKNVTNIKILSRFFLVANINPYVMLNIFFDTWLVFLYDFFWELNNILWFFVI